MQRIYIGFTVLGNRIELGRECFNTKYEKEGVSNSCLFQVIIQMGYFGSRSGISQVIAIPYCVIYNSRSFRFQVVYLVSIGTLFAWAVSLFVVAVSFFVVNASLFVVNDWLFVFAVSLFVIRIQEFAFAE